jgi:ATPase family associated with various cellular activities (AAA)
VSRHDTAPNGADSLRSLWLEGVPPGISDTDLALLRSRLTRVATDLAQSGHYPFILRLGYGQPPPPEPAAAQLDASPTFTAASPKHHFGQLILPKQSMERLLDCVAFYEVMPLVFGTWNLRSIEPNPSMAVNFRGPPGTGKTLAAHAIAHRLGLRILSARLSDLESKFHGDGPKNLAALFATAKNEHALLFIDEAESLLSRRFAQPEQAAESAINSMRTELLQALDAFEGLVIFASNLPHSYDAAIESRLFHVDFGLPDRDTRLRMWRAHLPSQLPIAPDVSLEELAEVENVSGRDIKMAVIMAAVSTARRHLTTVDQAALQSALEAQRDQTMARLERDTQGRLTEQEEATVADLLRERVQDPADTAKDLSTVGKM